MIRLVLHDLGIPFEDVRYTEVEWENQKKQLESSGLVPFGELISLTVGEQSLSMTSAIARMLAENRNSTGKQRIVRW